MDSTDRATAAPLDRRTFFGTCAKGVTRALAGCSVSGQPGSRLPARPSPLPDESASADGMPRASGCYRTLENRAAPEYVRSMTTFHGRVVAITGAASGIGRALALEMARRGARLALCDVDETGLQQTVRAIASHHVSAERVDVADRGAVEAWAEHTLAHHGQVDAIVNNAGVTVQETVADLSYEDLEWIVGINFWGVVHGTKAFLPHLLNRDTGWVVNLSSVLGLIGFPGQGSYTATKFAVRGLTEALRWELADTGVTVCSVHPGGVRTNIVRNGRLYRDATGRIPTSQMAARFEEFARTTPDRAARIIANGMARHQPRILVGADARFLDTLQRLAPLRYDAILRRFIDLIDP